MAKRLQLAANRRRIKVGADYIPVTRYLTELARLRALLSMHAKFAKVDECLMVERRVRAGKSAEARPWLDALMAERLRLNPLDAKVARPHDVRSRLIQAAPAVTRLTNWNSGFPALPESLVLPPVSDPLRDFLATREIELDGQGWRWIELASLHSSYFHENLSKSDVSANVLQMLRGLGDAWMRTVLVEQIRDLGGDFQSRSDVSNALKAVSEAEQGLVVWTNELRIGVFGAGERVISNAKPSQSATRDVAKQVLGALALATASGAGISAVLKTLPTASLTTSRTDTVDWETIVKARVKSAIHVHEQTFGPAHEPSFEVTLKSKGSVVRVTSGRKKTARREAFQKIAGELMPEEFQKQLDRVNRTHTAGRLDSTRRASQVHLNVKASHRLAVERISRSFEISTPGLVTQALTHSSWANENRKSMQRASQKDYGVLSTEGAEIAGLLFKHHNVLRSFSESLNVNDDAALAARIGPNRTQLADLFNELSLEKAVLHSSGTKVTENIAADVAQAVLGAAWRANGDLLAERTPIQVHHWLEKHIPTVDPVTALSRLLGPLGITVDYRQEIVAEPTTPTFRVVLQVGLSGVRPIISKAHTSVRLAKIDAANRAIELAAGSGNSSEDGGTSQSRSFRTGIIAAQVDRLATRYPGAHASIAEGLLGVDKVAMGDVKGFQAWANSVTGTEVSGGSVKVVFVDKLDSIQEFYRQTLAEHRRHEIRKQWRRILAPATEGAINDDSLLNWVHSKRPAELSILWELLLCFEAPIFQPALQDFILDQCEAIAHSSRQPLRRHSADVEEHGVLTMMIDGIDLDVLFRPVKDIVDSVVGTIKWESENGVLSAMFPHWRRMPGELGQAADAATTAAESDPWIMITANKLTTVLGSVEEVIAYDSAATLSALRHSLAELDREYGPYEAVNR